MVEFKKTPKPKKIEMAPSKKTLQKATTHWVKLMETLHSPPGSNSILTDLIRRYSEPHRYFHTLDHIVHMLDEYEKIGRCDAGILLAIWFHDVIYDPKSNKNEEISANKAMLATIAMGLPQSFGLYVYNLVRATDHLGTPDEYSKRIIMDLDFMSLGIPSDVFKENTNKIRKEFAHVDLSTFNAGRSKFLKTVLNRKHIYFTDYFQSVYEEQARKNIRSFMLEYA